MVAFTSSSDRLLHYLTAARTATPEIAAEICVSATADAQLYEFSELLTFPTIASLANTPHHKYYELLRLFAHGTVDDYRSAPTSFPPLVDAHWKKLRILTLVSLANGKSVLEYSVLQQKMGMESVRELEDVVLDAMYAGMIRARMDQRARRVEILSAVGRDIVTPTGVNEMIDTLKSWMVRSTELIEEIDDKINFISDHTALVKRQKAQTAANVDATRKHFYSEGASGIPLGSRVAEEDNLRPEFVAVPYPLGRGISNLEGKRATGLGNRLKR